MIPPAPHYFVDKTTKFVYFDFKHWYFFTRVYDVHINGIHTLRTSSKALWDSSFDPSTIIKQLGG